MLTAMVAGCANPGDHAWRSPSEPKQASYAQNNNSSTMGNILLGVLVLAGIAAALNSVGGDDEGCDYRSVMTHSDGSRTTYCANY